MTAVFFLAALPALYGQQAPAAPATPSADPSQPPADDQSTAPVPVDPKTGLPLTPAELREKEIDKYDPLKRDVDPAAKDQDPNRLTDRQQPAPAATPETPAAGTEPPPLPGSVAASEAAASKGGSTAGASGQDTSADGSSGGEFSGPAVLSRSYTLARPMDSEQVKWKVALGLTWSTDIGQTGAENSQGAFISTTTRGYGVTWSLSGRHVWKLDQLGVSYNANYTDYAGYSALSGMNNSLNLDYSHVVSRKLTFQLVESLQLLSQNYSLENPTLETGSSVANIDLATSPNVQLLNNTVRQSNSTLSMTYHQTNRLSWDLSAAYFIIGRSGQNFIGTTGSQASADVNYRLTRKATVGGFFSYTNYQYSHNVAESDSYSAGAIYSYALTRTTQLRTRLGGTRIENLGYATVALPPELAAILGQPSTIVNAYTLRWISDISAELVRDFHRNRTANIAFAKGESPGNGVLLTSTQETISAGYSTRLFRSVSANGGVTYSSLESIGQGNIGYYNSYTYSGGVTKDLRRGKTANFRVDYRRYSISNSPLLQHDLRFSVGFTWSPDENSLRF